MTTPFRRTRIAGPSPESRSRWARATRSAPASACRAERERARQRLCGRRRGGRGRQHRSGPTRRVWRGSTKMQVVAALHSDLPSAKFRTRVAAGGRASRSAAPAATPGSVDFVPNLYFGVPINDKWSFGIGVNAPFGLMTEYDYGWLGRFQAIKSKIKTINVNPALSWKLDQELHHRRRRQLPAAQGDAHQATPTTRRRCCRPQRRPASPRDRPTVNAHRARPTAGLESCVNITGDDDAGAGTSAPLWTGRHRTTRIGAPLSFEHQVQRRRQRRTSPTRRCRPGAAAPIAADRRRAGRAARQRRRAVQRGASRSDIKMPEIGQPLVFQQDQRPNGT